MRTPSIYFLISIALPTFLFAQHDPGRNSMRLLAEEKTDEAIKLVAKAPKKKNSPIDEAEKSYVLAIAACQKGDAEAAFGHLKHAVENGLAIERVQAASRKLLGPLEDHAKFQEWLSSKEKQLLHGPLLGSVTDSSASFWVRTAEEADIWIVARPFPQDPSNREEFIGTGRTSAGQDYTATVEISGLQPATAYQYKVLVNDKKIGLPAEFRTFPKQGTDSRFSIAFGGGAGFTPEHERMWTTIAKHDVSALLLLGDNVYIDDPTHPVTQHYCYYRRQSQPEWQQLTRSTSVFTIYDDHDFGMNDCALGPEIETPPWKRDVWNVFRENWNNPAYGGGDEQPGCWYDFHIGNVHFIMLDGRYYRDLKGGSMLGGVQKAWLKDTLKSSKSAFKVLVSPVPWSPGVKPGSKDTWDGFSAEREEIFSLIEKNQINGVLLMGADRHRSDMRKIKRPNGYDFYEVMSSRLTNVHTHGLLKNAKGSEFVMGYNEDCSFGLVTFDTAAAEPEVTYSIVNIDNEVVGTRTLKLDQLSFGGSGAGLQDQNK